MGVSTTTKQTRTEQCRKNAQAKSDQKRQATFAAIEDLKLEQLPVTRSAVARRAGVSVVFLRSHPDLLQAIAEAEQQHQLAPEDHTTNPAKDVVIAALRRRLDEQKLTLAEKDAELRQKQREIDRLYGKLAAGSPLTDEELRQQLHAALRRLALLDDQSPNEHRSFLMKERFSLFSSHPNGSSL